MTSIPFGPLTQWQTEALVSLLDAHTARDAKERRDCAAIALFLTTHDDAHLRSNPRGHLTGSAFVLDARRERVLLTHHRRLDRWLQLGGHGEGEWDPAAIALREAREESGLTDLVFLSCCPEVAPHGLRRPFDVDIHEIPATVKELAHLHLDLRYVLAAPPDAELRLDATESRALAWFTFDKALAMAGDLSLVRALTWLRVWVRGERGSGPDVSPLAARS